ncbi:MAG: hypothetical protein Q7S45_01145 [Candidatus Curtissbacteria bacterium]|nr:hypothetical protein [Candidatus Curtissbacteria bacterium]
MRAKKILFFLVCVPFLLSGCIPSVGQQDMTGKDEYIRGAAAPGFPSVPLYKGAQVVESYGFEGKFGASLITGGDLSRVVKFYSETLPTLGWDASVSASGVNSFTFDIKNQTQQGTIIVNTAADGETTAITISVLPTSQ